MEKKDKIYASGKRKRAVARATITKGSGKLLYNKKEVNTLNLFDKLKLIEPVRISEEVLGKIDFDIFVNARGGGEKGQIDAARIAIARAIIAYSNSEELKQAFTEYDRSLIVADVRHKEACKPGDSKARAMRQSSKR
jgi:small subunit ribosomal protein S9